MPYQITTIKKCVNAAIIYDKLQDVLATGYFVNVARAKLNNKPHIDRSKYSL